MVQWREFCQKLVGLKWRCAVSLTSLSMLLIMLPGQNEWQILGLRPQSPRVKSSSISLPLPAEYPVVKPGVKEPYISAQAAIIIDVESGVILLAKNPDMKLMPASTTKIMTAAVVLEEYDLNEMVTIENEDRSVGHTANLSKGERLTVEDLLYGMLVNSGNDAALALAQWHIDGYSGFVKMMNQKAEEWNLTNSKYRNVSGIEQAGHYTSVRDLSLLTKQMLRNPTFSRIVGTESIRVIAQTGQNHYWENINELLGAVEGIKGVKTGWTENAGECLVTAVERDGHEIITVVLGSKDRFGDSRRLIEWAYASHEWTKPE